MTIGLCDEARVSPGKQEIVVVSGITGALRTLRWASSSGALEVANGRRKRLTATIAISITGIPIFLYPCVPAHGSGKVPTSVLIL